jgi:hypothetical protein
MAVANHCQLLVVRGNLGKTSFFHWDSEVGVLRVVVPRKVRETS